MALTHLNQRGEAYIVDIGDKATTRRRAVATARLEATPETVALILGGELNAAISRYLEARARVG